MADPSLEIRPDFASGAYRVVREAIMANFNEDVEQATERLTSAWDTEHDLRIEAWNLAQAAEAREAERIQREQRERETEQRRLEEAEAEKERREADKKKPKINDFNETRPPPSVITPRPSQYAIQKITAFDYVELWYFSLEGCTEASRNQKSQADDTFGLTSSNDVLTLRPVASVKASRLARADHDLSFSELLQAKNTFLTHIKRVSWPDKHINALAEFFWNLENHPVRVTENGDKIALHYASRIWRQWHDDLKNNTGSAFNISLISDALMNSIAFETNTSMQVAATRKVSIPSPFPSHPSLTPPFSLLLSLLITNAPSPPTNTHTTNAVATPHLLNQPVPWPCPTPPSNWCRGHVPTTPPTGAAAMLHHAHQNDAAALPHHHPSATNRHAHAHTIQPSDGGPHLPPTTLVPPLQTKPLPPQPATRIKWGTTQELAIRLPSTQSVSPTPVPASEPIANLLPPQTPPQALTQRLVSQIGLSDLPRPSPPPSQ